MSLAKKMAEEIGEQPSARITKARVKSDGAFDLFGIANDIDIEDTMQRLGLMEGEQPKCPGCKETDQGVAIVKGGLKCQHERCAKKGVPGKPGFRTATDLVAEVHGISPADAAKMICGWRGIEVPKSRVAESAALSDPGEPREWMSDGEDSTGEFRSSEQPTDSFTWISISEILTEPLPDVRLVVPGMELGPGRPNAIQALGGSGKSDTAIDIGLSVATGTKAFGHFDVQRGTVAHISHELTRRSVLSRYRRFANARGLALEDFGDRLRITCLPRLFLNSPGAEDAYLRAFDGCALGVIDSLRRALPGADENASEMSNYLDILTRVSAKTDVAFLVLHHFGKAEQGDPRLSGRGSTAIMDGSGCIWSMDGRDQQPRKLTQVRPGDDTEGEAAPFYLTMERVFVAEPAFPVSRPAARLVYHDESAMGDRLAHAAVQSGNDKIQRVERLILETVRDSAGISKNRLEELVVKTKLISSKPFRALLEELIDREWLAVTNGPKNAQLLTISPVR